MTTILSKLRLNLKKNGIRPYSVFNNDFLEDKNAEFIYKNNDISIYRVFHDIYFISHSGIVRIMHSKYSETFKTINKIKKWFNLKIQIQINPFLCSFIHLEGVLEYYYKKTYNQLKSKYNKEFHILDLIRRSKKIYIGMIIFNGNIDFEEQFEKMMLYTRETNYKQQQRVFDLKQSLIINQESIRKKCESLKKLPIEKRIELLKSN